MSDLISRQDAIKAILATDGEIRPSVLEEIINRLNMVLSAEPKNGKWILEPYLNDTWVHRCNQCMKVAMIGSRKTMNFCPNCGADNRKKGEE